MSQKLDVKDNMEFQEFCDGETLPVKVEPPTAGLLIIGDEILKGHTKDTNSYFLLTRLWSLGVKVKAVSVISDNVDEIAQHVHDFSSRFTYVLTSGGIGPTHDDMTVQAVGKAFDEPLIHNQELAKVIASAYGIRVENLSTFHLKMAQIPSSAKVMYDNGVAKSCIFPLVSVHNVYIFPGVPLLLEKLFDSFAHVFSSKGMNFCLEKLYLHVEESTIAAQLQDVHDRYGDNVNIGSYPEINCAEYQTKLILESLSPTTLTKAVDHLLNILPPNTVVKREACQSGQEVASTKTDGASMKGTHQQYTKVYSLLSKSDMSNLSSCVKGSWAVLQQALEQYSLEELCISFNGGKDCTALLHLYCAAIMKKYPSFTNKLTALYIQVDSPFVEAEDFISHCVTTYNLNIITINENIKEALQFLKKSHPQVKAILMGTRKRDPYCDGLKLFSPTDEGWPLYMRINPVLNWSYSDIWHLLRECEVPYLSLYDQGYTSIGGVHNTKPNPALKLKNGDYMPAYMLIDVTKERDGRN